jgi:hypothetical protein
MAVRTASDKFGVGPEDRAQPDLLDSCCRIETGDTFSLERGRSDKRHLRAPAWKGLEKLGWL